MDLKANTTNFSIQTLVNNTSNLNGSKTGFEEGQPTAFTIAQVIFYYVMILLSLIGNTVVIKTVRRIRKKITRKVHYIFIVNLSVADLLFAVENIPLTYTYLLMNGAWKIEGFFGNILCRLDLFLSLILILTTNLTILAIAVEKFRGIFFPMRTFISRKRSYVIVVSTWVIGALYASPLLWSNFANLVLHPDGYFQCFLCIQCEKVVQWFIVQTVLLATGFITTLILYSAIGIKIWLGKTPGFRLHEVKRKGKEKKYRAIKMLAMLVVVFYISFIPFWIFQISIYFSFHERLGSNYGQISAFLMYCNGAINPLIYSLYNLDIRGQFKALLKCRRAIERPPSFTTFRTRRQTEDVQLRNLSRLQSPRKADEQLNSAYIARHFEDWPKKFS